METKQKKPRTAPSSAARTKKRPTQQRRADQAAPQPAHRRREAQVSGEQRGTRTSRPRAAAQTERRSSVRTQAAAPRRGTGAASTRKKRTESRIQTAEVVYTPPKPFNRSRFLLHLATVVAVVLALSLGISIFFKVETVTVSGNEKYDAWTVKEASGIEIGDNLLSFGEAKAAGKIKTALPYVQEVRIGIKLPDTVNIEIKELDVVYAIKDAEGQWWLITAEGRVVDKADRATAGESTQIEGVKLANPVPGQQAVAYEEPAGTSQDGSQETLLPVIVRGSDRLVAALDILQYLESCGIIGAANSVNVTDLSSISLRYENRLTVKLGDTTQMLYKIKCMDSAINGTDPVNSLKEYDSGTLDVSFTIMADKVIYEASEE